MNNRKAKAIRKLIYGKGRHDIRKYVRDGKKAPIINVAEMEEVTITTTKQTNKIPKRKLYQYVKKIGRNVPIKQLRKVFQNENPTNN